MNQLFNNDRIPVLLIAMLLVVGFSSLVTMPRSEDPFITQRGASIITEFPGASAERVEALVSEKIEATLRQQPEINLISSSSSANISVVRIELQDSITEVAPVWSRIRDLLSDVESELPAGAGTPELDDDHGYAFTRIVGLKFHNDHQGLDQNNDDLAVLKRYALSLKDKLQNLPNTDFVELYGDPKEEVRVALNAYRSADLQMSAGQIAQLIAQSDAKVAAGQLHNPDNQYAVELTGALDSLQRIREIPLQTGDNATLVHLGDIADVQFVPLSPASNLVLLNGEKGIVVAARMLSGTRISDWTQDVNQLLARYQAQLPADIELVSLFDQSTYTQDRLTQLVENIALGFALICAVLFITLGWRAAIIVALALPLSVGFTLASMNFYGLPIHQMSVTGLVVALGIMVDNAIVMTDAIQQKRQAGATRAEAVNSAIRHLWIPLLGSTLTTILAFMPIVLMPGPSGEFVGGIALSVIFSLIGSYLVSHLIIAPLAGRFLSAGHGKQRWYHRGINTPWLARPFKASVRLGLKVPVLTLLLALALPAAGIWGAGQLKEQFFPPSDRDMFQIQVFMPSQSSLAHTQSAVEAINQELAKYPELTQINWFIGGNAPAFYYNLAATQQGAKNFAQAMITADSFISANRLVPVLQAALDNTQPDAQILVRRLEQGPPFNAPVELRIFGPNLDKLKALGDELRLVLSQTEDVLHTRATLVPGTPKVWVDINPNQAAISGLSLVEISNQLNHMLYGATGGTVLEVNESIPVRVTLPNNQKESIEALGNLQLVSPSLDHPIPLSSVAELKLAPSRGAIARRDGERINTIEGYITAGVLPAVVLERVTQRLDEINFTLPSGYRLEVGGESAERNDAVGNLLSSVGLIVALLITVLVLSFNSYRLCALILATASLSAALGLLSVYVFNYPFGFTVIIGLLGLMGLAINAAIVILAELKADTKAIEGDDQAIIDAVSSCTRHITSTTITTVGGFMPLILAEGNFWPPFAVAIAGGTVLTTLLSFYFVPAAFKLLTRIRRFELTGGGAAKLAADG